MTLYLAEIALAVAPGAHAVVLMDQAGWHMTGKLDWNFRQAAGFRSPPGLPAFANPVDVHTFPRMSSTEAVPLLVHAVVTRMARVIVFMEP